MGDQVEFVCELCVGCFAGEFEVGFGGGLGCAGMRLNDVGDIHSFTQPSHHSRSPYSQPVSTPVSTPRHHPQHFNVYQQRPFTLFSL